jgi:sulfofructose kinase
MGPSHVAITRGARGLVGLSDEGYLEMPAFDVEVVDTTGAGDTLHGAFCFGLTQGYGFEDNLVFSSAVAAMKCRRIGGRAGIPRFAEVQAFLRERRSSHPVVCRGQST